MSKKKLLSMLLCFWISSMIAMAQRTITGTVYSQADNEPVVGASVLVKGTRVGGVTDINGRFSIPNVPATAKQVEISYVGMTKQVVTIKPDMKVYLADDAKNLDEVVVQVAYGSAKKSTLTGAVTQVDSKELSKRPVSSVVSALEGSTSGVQVNSTYGEPGSDATIRVRGFGTVNGSSSPLYVLDGVPFGGSISDINPNDVESIAILKDAASCALYGNRASNGVILITTKKGSGDKMSFTLKASLGTYSRGMKEYKTLNARQFMNASWQNMRNARISAGDTPEAAASYTSKNLIDEFLYLNIFNKDKEQLFDANGKLVSDASILDGYRGDLDWYDQTIRHGARQEYNLSGSQYTSKSDYYFSIGYLDENGYLKNSDFTRLSGRAKLNFRPKTWFNTGFSINGTHQSQNFSSGDSDASFTNPFMYCRNIAPIYPVHLHNADGSYIYDSKGNRQYDPGYYTKDGQEIQTRNQYADRHVIWENELDIQRFFKNTLQSSAYVDFKFLNDFTLSLIGELNVRNTESRTYDNATIGNGKGNQGRTGRTFYRYKNYTFQQQLKWGHQFDKHDVNVLLGHENYYYNYDRTEGHKSKEVFAGQDNLSNFTSIRSMDGYDANYRTESYLGRVRYTYDDKYTGEVSLRRDGSSRFAKESRWGSFYSLGASWMVSKEDFMKPLTWVNSLKLRADYGEVGNDAGAGYYGYMALYTAEQNANLGAYYLTQLSNRSLKWETGAAFGFAVDARLFNRWNLSVEYFDRRNRDLIFDVYLPLSAGATSSRTAESVITKNLGIISNRGFEINTDVDLYRTREWTVNLGMNATFINNKIVKLPEQNKEGIISGIYKIEEGRSRYEFYTYTYVGVDQMTGNSLYKANLNDYYVKASDGTIVGNEKGTDMTSKATKIGDQYYVNNTTYALKEYHGSPIPKVYGSFSLNTRYKQFALSAMFTYQLGGKVFDGVYSDLMSTGTSPHSLASDIMKSWTSVPEGMTETSANRIWYGGIPQINNKLSSDNNATSSRWLTSASYLVFKNLNFSYSLPRVWVHKLDLDDITFNVACENLFTKTARQGMNPQQSFSGTQRNYLVTPRVFTFGINVKF